MNVDDVLMSTLRGRRVLVTGGLGMVGSSIVRRLATLGAQITTLDNATAYPFDYGREFGGLTSAHTVIKGDLEDTDSVESACRDQDFVIHAAAYADVAGCIANYQEDFRSNVLGTMNLLDAVKRHRPERFLFVSSASVYGELPIVRGLPAVKYSEEMTTVPLSTYANSKLWGERQTTLFYELYGIPTTSVRYFSVYGPPQLPKFGSHSWCVAIFSIYALLGKPITIFGDGNQIRDFTYIDDIVTGSLLGLVRPNAIGQTFNLGTGVSTTVLDVANAVRSVISNVPIEYLARRDGDPRGGSADTTRMTELLAWSPQTSFESGLHRYRDWLLQHQDLIPSWVR